MSQSTILIVEHNSDLRELTVEALESEGLEVIGTSSIADAIELLATRDFSLVVTDSFVSTGTDRWRSVEQLLKAAGPVPVGLLTGWTLDEGEVRRRGFAFLISKPFVVETFLATVGAFCRPEPLRESQRAAITTYFDALSRKDWGALSSVCTPSVVYNLPGDAPLGATISGREAFCRYAEATFTQFEDARFQVQSIVPLRHAVITRYVGSWRGEGGATMTLPGAVLFRFGEDDKKIQEVGVRLELRKLLDAASVRR